MEDELTTPTIETPPARRSRKSSVVLLVFLLSTLVSSLTTLTLMYLILHKPNLLPNFGKAFHSSVSQTFNNDVVNEESAVIKAVEKVNPAVVSIVISKDLPIIERRYKEYDPFSGNPFNFFFGPQVEEYQSGTEKKEIGGGSGFIVTKEGMIVTNKHVVEDETASYTVITNDGQKLEAAVLARHPSTDLAILKVKTDKDLPFVELGTSTNLKAGQMAIAIGNALAEFRNTVSLGVISGLSRNITAGGGMGSSTETLEDVIQTDAAINPGNSGGPLVNLSGQVIGVNTAIVSGAQNIGFAIPVEVVKQALESVEKNGKITKAFLGVRYTLITPEVVKANNLSVDYGALVVRGESRNEPAVMPGSPADKAGLVENDIILEINGKKINEDNSLAKAISKLTIGDKVTLKILHKGEEKVVSTELGELK